MKKDMKRRSLLKKGAKFVIPTVVSFKIGELKVQASTPPGGLGSEKLAR